MTVPEIKKYFVAGYRRRTLLFVSLFTAAFSVAIIAAFFLQDLQHKKMDDDRTVRAVSKMLAESMRLPLYAGNYVELHHLAEYAISTFHISKIQIVHPDGKIYLEVPSTPISKEMASSRTPIVINQALDPSVVISGEVPTEQQLGVVIASTTGTERMRELFLALASLSIAALLLWLIATYIGYIIMRKLTESFDNLIEAIDDIEQGKSETIDIELQDEARFIARSINRLSLTLHERERQNVSLQQELIQQMEQRAETAEQIMQAKLIQADKMSSLGMLVGCMGHEINNPNAMIRLHIEFIKQIALDSQPLLQSFAEGEGNFSLAGYPFKIAEKMLFDSIEGAHNQTFRIERVISELRNYATADSREKTMIGLDRAVFGTMVLLNPELKRYEGKIINKIDSGNKRNEKSGQTYTGTDRRAKVMVNQYSLQQVIVNLLHNSIRATTSLGKDGVVSLEILSQPDVVELILSDNGEGIHPDDLPKLCDPYFSRNLDNGGTGLGLFIAKQIIDDHNATMEFRSEFGVGTSVSLKFPTIRNKEPRE